MKISYANPIIPGFYPDPSVCRVGQDYYLVTSSFEYFPGVPLFHSRDMVNWKQIGHCLTRDSQLPLQRTGSSAGIYAPTIRHHNGRFYMVTTNVRGGGNFYVWADDPAGPWSDPIWVDQKGIDPSLLFDDDGRVYFVSTESAAFPGVSGAIQSQIGIATGKLIGPPVHLWGGTGGQCPEAPHVFKRNGWYYLMLAEGGTEFGHMVTLARSRAAGGPYESCPFNPILSHRSIGSPLQSTGHADLLEDHQGRWWMVFLACRHVGYPKAHHIGRETCLAPATWTDDGWCVINGGRPVALEMQTDGIASQQCRCGCVLDDFDSPSLALAWNFRRNPDPTAWSLGRSPGSLSLRCVAATLGDIAAPAFIGRRQQHLTCTVRTLVDFSPAGREEAGLNIVMNERHRCDLAIVQRDGRRVVLLRRCVGSLIVETALTAIPAGPAVLQVRAEPAWYHFSVQVDGQPSIDLGKAETRHLSTELAGGFTGVYFGMYATGNGLDTANHAQFDWFEYESFENPAPAAR